MAFLENGIKGRTVHNGSLWGDARVAWQITARLNLPEVQSIEGTGEVARTGRHVLEERTYHLLAPPNEEMARALWHETIDCTVVVGEPKFEPLFAIDGEINYRRK